MKKKTRKRAVWSIEEDLHFYTNLLRQADNITQASKRTSLELNKTFSHCLRRYEKLRKKFSEYHAMLRTQAKKQLQRGIAIDVELVQELKEQFPKQLCRSEIQQKELSEKQKVSASTARKLLPASAHLPVPTSPSLVQDVHVIELQASPPPLTISAKLFSKIEDLDIDANGDIKLQLKPVRRS